MAETGVLTLEIGRRGGTWDRNQRMIWLKEVKGTAEKVILGFLA